MRGGVALGAEKKIVQECFFFSGKRHDNKTLKVQILLSRKSVVIAQAPRQSATKRNIFHKRWPSLSHKCYLCVKNAIVAPPLGSSWPREGFWSDKEVVRCDHNVCGCARSRARASFAITCVQQAFPTATLRQQIVWVGRKSGWQIERKCGRFFGAFSCFMCCAEWPHQIFLPNFSDLSLHALLLKYQNQISASFWGLEGPTLGTILRSFCGNPSFYLFINVCCCVRTWGAFLRFNCSIMLPLMRSKMGRAASDARKTLFLQFFVGFSSAPVIVTGRVKDRASSWGIMPKMRQFKTHFWSFICGTALWVPLCVLLALSTGGQKAHNCGENGQSRNCAINNFWTKNPRRLSGWGSRGSRQIIYVRIFPNIWSVFGTTSRPNINNFRDRRPA